MLDFHPTHFRTFHLGDSVMGLPSCVNIYNKELCEIISKISKTQEIWKNQQMTNIQTHNSNNHGSTANDVHPHKFYGT